MDIVAAVLIISRQITVASVWLTRGGGFGISFTGDILGGAQTEAIPGAAGADIGIYTIGLVAALLIILDQVNIIGVYIGPGRVSFVIGGPAFGGLKVDAYTPTAREFFTDYRQYVFNTFNEGSRGM